MNLRLAKAAAKFTGASSRINLALSFVECISIDFITFLFLIREKWVQVASAM